MAPFLKQDNEEKRNMKAIFSSVKHEGEAVKSLMDFSFSFFD